MKPTLKQIEAFVQVADMGSFRKAAGILNTTQPNISARIAALEELLGARLMERDAGSVRLTSQGVTLLPHARAVLRTVDTMISATGNAALHEGVLRLGVTELVVHTWLASFLRALKQAAPNVLVELTVDLSANLSRTLMGRGLDLTFQTGPFQRRTTGHADLGQHPLVWVASPSLGIASGVPLAIGDIVAHPILTHARGTLPYDQLGAHVAASHSRPVLLVPSSNLAACLQMTLDGYGVACLPHAMVATALSERRLIALDYGWQPDPLHLAARFDQDRAPAFLHLAVQLAKDQKY